MSILKDLETLNKAQTLLSKINNTTRSATKVKNVTEKTMVCTSKSTNLKSLLKFIK